MVEDSFLVAREVNLVDAFFGYRIHPSKYFMQLKETEVASLPVLSALELAGPWGYPLGKKDSIYSRNSINITALPH